VWFQKEKFRPSQESPKLPGREFICQKREFIPLLKDFNVFRDFNSPKQEFKYAF
jgi:hypothetical protein